MKFPDLGKLFMFSCTGSNGLDVEPVDPEHGSTSTRSIESILTAYQRKLIISTWQSVEDHAKLGQTIYLQIFMHKPSLKVRLFLQYVLKPDNFFCRPENLNIKSKNISCEFMLIKEPVPVS